jgi:hypothetical protein
VAIVRGRGAIGATVHEVADALGKVPSDISGRLTELRGMGRLQLQLDADGNPTRRGGARVLILSDHSPVASLEPNLS